jgi:hypothetical protein
VQFSFVLFLIAAPPLQQGDLENATATTGQSHMLGLLINLDPEQMSLKIVFLGIRSGSFIKDYLSFEELTFFVILS